MYAAVEHVLLHLGCHDTLGYDLDVHIAEYFRSKNATTRLPSILLLDDVFIGPINEFVQSKTAKGNGQPYSRDQNMCKGTLHLANVIQESQSS